ncbi:hypothetical protein COU37_02185 [Candidatus Micrarchaeota archaeon CG10_big_fil_rev_8_21_14_0_10_45_29]|nr:MAG: hypothetical protein COU37_02185 [Candidatus Micrarchaeota archaeon CG10_big_fil_rev_8_21_14_0_10_45_29]
MKKTIKEFFSDVAQARGHSEEIVLGFALLYLIFTLFAIVLPIFSGEAIMLHPDYLFFAFFFVAYVIKKKNNTFLKDFGPLFLLLFAYDAMRGYANEFGQRVEFNMPIKADMLLGGGALPAEQLQHVVNAIGAVQFADWISIFVYSFHFTIPLIFGFLIWFNNRERYYHFMVTIIILSYLALITFWVFPVAPPWMAAESGMVGIEHRFPIAAKEYGISFLEILYWVVNANPVAAVPSLHFAYPFAALLFAVRNKWKEYSLFFFAYCILVLFSILYLGEHYVIDALIAIPYVFVAEKIANFLLDSKLKN